MLQTPIALTRAGVGDLDAVAVAADAGGSDWWQATGAEFVYVYNGNAGALTVTLPYNGPQGTIDGQAVPARTVPVPAGQRKLIGPFPAGLYQATATGFVTVQWSLTAGVKLAVVRWQPN